MNATKKLLVIEAARRAGIKIQLLGQDGVYLQEGSNVRLRKMRDDLEAQDIKFLRLQLGNYAVEGFAQFVEMGTEPAWFPKKEAPKPKAAATPKAKTEGGTAFKDGEKAKGSTKKTGQIGPSLFDQTVSLEDKTPIDKLLA